MLKNYLLTAWRNITRHKVHSAINVIGLSLGMTCCLLIFLWVQDEKSIDDFHRNGKNLYSVYETITTAGRTTGSYATPIQYDSLGSHILLEGMQQAVPEIKYQAFYATGYELPWGHPETFRAGDKLLKLEGSRASEDFFKLFSYPLIEGDAQSALKGISSIAISRKMAELFFGSPTRAMGQTLLYENHLNFTVSAVFENLTPASSLRFDFLLNWEAQKKLLDWSSNDCRTFVQLLETATIGNTTDKINRYLQTRLHKEEGVRVQEGLQRFGEGYLHSFFVNGQPSGGRIEYVRIFSGVALFILLIACINFMNLATARSIGRAREIGLRKVVGSTRGQLIGQFLGEAFLFALFALVFSLGLFYLLLPAFNHFTGKELSFPAGSPSFWLSILALALVTGLFAGSYPALYLSSLQPIRVLKGVIRFTRSAIWFRKGLTVFQFVLSILLIIATIVITRQTYYIQHVHLGYDRENLVYIRIEGELTKQRTYRLFKDEASRLPDIAGVDRSSEAPHAMDFVVTDPVNWEGKGKNEQVGFKPASVGYDFIRLMNLKILQGRDFSRANVRDSSDAFMINEEAVKETGMKDPLGKWISAWGKRGHIIAVVKDYHTHSLREPIMPVILDVKEDLNFGVIIVRTQAGKTREALAGLAKIYRDLNPGYAFSSQFVDEEYRKLYNSEVVMSQLSILFAVLAILISCLGLLGLVLFAAQQRTREIGIRRVLGASLTQIFGLFSKDFLSLVGLAFLIAAPLGWYFMRGWLQDFAYRIDLSWWIFLLAGSSTAAIAMLTMSYQALRAGRANPVKSLKQD